MAVNDRCWLSVVGCRFFKAGYWWLVVICLYLLSTPPVLAQNNTNPTANYRLPTTNNRQPLFWADGITRADQLADYARAGFNTVVVHLFWQPTQDGSIVAADLEPQRAFAEAAARQNLNVIYALPPSPFGQENLYSYSAEAGPYRVLWANWAQRAIQRLRDTPNLIGWMLPDDPRRLAFAHERGFARWVAANYGNIQILNRQWNSNFESFDTVTLEGARQVVAAWRGPVLPTGAMTPEQGRAYILQGQRRRADENFAFHPASLALAHYQWDAYRTLLDFWATTVRVSDPRHLVFSGRLPDYAQLLSLPASIDVSLPAMSPAIAEPDLASHNPQAVDIARRGGRFRAIPTLATRLPNVAPDALARLVPSWCDAALAHGAGGLAFESWPDIQQNQNLRRVLNATFGRLQSAEYSHLWHEKPVASLAVVLTPLADGATLHIDGQASPTAPVNAATGRGFYGFGEDMVAGEPNGLVFALRWGSAFGGVDFLSPDELGGGYSSEQFGLLKRYGAVLLPQALSISPGMAQELASYVAGGGVIVTDLGLGAAQNGGQTVGLPKELTIMFGVVPTSLQTVAFNLKPGQGHPLLPTWAAQAAMNSKVLTSGDGPDGAAFAGPMAFGELMPGTVPLALAFDMTRKLPGRNPNDPSDDVFEVNRSWLTLRPFGSGSALFAPFRLWNLWRPGHPGWDGFHGDLFARGAHMAMMSTPTLTSTPVGTPTGTAQFCEAVNFPNAIALLNHNAAPNMPYAWQSPSWTTPRSGTPAPANAANDSIFIPSGAGQRQATEQPRPPGPTESLPPAPPASPSQPRQLPQPAPRQKQNDYQDYQETPSGAGQRGAYAPAPRINARALHSPRLAERLSQTSKQSSKQSSTPAQQNSKPARRPAQKVPAKPAPAASDTTEPIVLTPEELAILQGGNPAPSTPPPALIAPTPGAPTPGAFPIVPGSQIMPGDAVSAGDVMAPAARNPLLPAIVQTTGAEYFLWQNALCVFPVGAALTATPGRTTPLPMNHDEFVVGSIVRPLFYHPVILHAFVPAMEMKVLRPLPIRAQHTQGGPLTANAPEYSPQKIELRIWPNAHQVFPRDGDWRITPDKEGTVKVTIFDSTDDHAYRIAPGSRHRVAVSQRSLDDGGNVLSITNYQVKADGQGRLNFELTGIVIGIEVTPLS